MSKALPYTLTNDSVIVVWEGKNHTVRKGAPNFIALRNAVLDEDWEAVPKNLTTAKSVKEWAQGKFTVKDDTFYFEDVEVPNEVNQRILTMVTNNEDPTPVLKFWERLQKNPSFRSVRQLFSFLQHSGIPLTSDGCFLAYKGVTSELKDAHTQTISNKPGIINEMPRNQISDDPEHACHEGFHVGALGYAGSFSQRVVVCKVDPEHVVCVPHDASQQKMRVCRYEVIGLHNGQELPSTTYLEDKDDPQGRTQLTPGVEEVEEDDDSDTNYDPENDFLAEPCDECGNKIPPDYAAEDNKYHEEVCVHYDSTHPSEEAAPTKPKKKVKAKSKGAEKKERKTKNKALKKIAKGFDKLKKMDMRELLEQSIDDLRQYAGKALKIVGASKIPGGKTALVTKILAARK